MMKDEREEEQGLKASFSRWLDAKAEEKKALAEQRRRLEFMAGCTQNYFLWGGRIFEALQGLSDAIVMKPVALSQVITDEVFRVSVPAQYVYCIDVTGNHKEVCLRLRKGLAALMGVQLQDFIRQIEVKVIGNNILLKKV